MNTQLKIIAAAAALTFAPIAGQAESIFASKIDWDGVDNAGFDGDGSPTAGSRTDPDNALGAPDTFEGAMNRFLSIGLGGTAVFDFGAKFNTAARVFEVTFNCAGGEGDGCADHPEQVEVFAGNTYTRDSFELVGFESLGMLSNQEAQSGATKTFSGDFQYLALVDHSEALGSASMDGFDVDAVSVEAVPLPASALLFASALGGLGVFSRRRKA